LKIIYWNIGKGLSDKKCAFIGNLIYSENPDIFCIAEGTNSKTSCEKLSILFSKYSYISYYEPRFTDESSYKLNYKFNRNGLKVFFKNNITLEDKFAFHLQREEGRIIIMNLFINYNPTSIIFLHNFSKSGGRDVNDTQKSFLSQLNTALKFKNLGESSSRNIIIGDFNVEPWDNILRQNRYLETSFFKKQNDLHQRNSNILFNPTLNFIQSSKIDNLVGTYYSNSYGWALFDYALYNSKKFDLEYEIITKLDKRVSLLNVDNKLIANFLYHNLDHLPIKIKIVR